MFGVRRLAALAGAFMMIRRSLAKALSRRGKESAVIRPLTSALSLPSLSEERSARGPVRGTRGRHPRSVHQVVPCGRRPPAVNWRAPGAATSSCGCAAQHIWRVGVGDRPTSGRFSIDWRQDSPSSSQPLTGVRGAPRIGAV
jgi:hypothetical protein